MTPEQRVRLCHKRWLNRANSVRAEIRNAIASVLHKSAMEVEFTDFGLTREIRSRFAEQLKDKEELIVPNRSAAIELVTDNLGEMHCLAFLLHNGCDESGMIKLNFNEAIACIDGLLKSQNEYFGIISHDGTIGACVTVEEGTAPHYPRHVVIWKDEKREEKVDGTHS